MKERKNTYTRNLFRIIGKNFKTILRFEIIFKTITSLILLPLATSGLNLTMKLTGYNYLTYENIKQFLTTPLAIVFLLIIIIYLTFITMFDIATLIIIFDQSYQGKKINMIDAVKISIKKCIAVFHPKNIFLSFFVLFLIPILNIGISTNVITTLKIPEFISDYIFGNFFLLITLILLYVIFAVLFVNWMYSFHYFILEGKSFRQSRKKSYNLIKKYRTRDVITIGITELLKFVVFAIIIVIGIILIIGIHNILNHIKIFESALITIIWIFIALSLIFFYALSNAISFAMISSLFYSHKDDIDEEIKNINYERLVKDKKNNKIFAIINIILFIITLSAGTFYTYQVINGKTNLNIEHVRNLEITAHRGASEYYPENTMAAFKGAKELGADWVELDVQQTRDKKIVVIHDTNLKRITGVNKNVIELDYDEIRKLDAGSHFNKEFKGEKIPLLEEVIKYASDNNLRLNIELKPTGKEIDFEKSVIEIIKKYNFKDNCIVTSGYYEVLEKVKEMDKDIKTYYVMSIAIGDITKLDKADGFSVEASNINKKLVKKIHNSGKELLAWTVNSEETINKMIDLGVDNIITDDITLARDLVVRSKKSDLITEYIKFIQSMFG